MLDMCNLSNDIFDYHVVSQGKTTIPNVDDGEEFVLTDVIFFFFFKYFAEMYLTVVYFAPFVFL